MGTSIRGVPEDSGWLLGMILNRFIQLLIRNELKQRHVKTTERFETRRFGVVKPELNKQTDSICVRVFVYS